MKTKILAHRGSSAYAPENTLAAFALAIEQGADGIELDVHFTKDLVPIVTHDDNVNRVTGYNGLVKELTLEEIKKLSFDNKMAGYIGEKAPTLEEVFVLMKPSNLIINVELKTNHQRPEGLEEACQALVKKYNMEDRIIYSSFNHHSLNHLKTIASHMPCGILFDCNMFKEWNYAKTMDWQAIHPHFKSVYGKEYIQACQNAGIACNAWTVDNPENIKFLLNLGVDGIITNVPDIALAIRDK